MLPPDEVKDSAAYESPLPRYLAEAKRDAFLEGARWALDQHLCRVRLEGPLTDEVVTTAARAYAGLQP